MLSEKGYRLATLCITGFGTVLAIGSFVYVTGWKSAEIEQLKRANEDHEQRLRVLVVELGGIKSEVAVSRSKIDDIHRWIVPPNARGLGMSMQDMSATPARVQGGDL